MRGWNVIPCQGPGRDVNLLKGMNENLTSYQMTAQLITEINQAE